MLGVKKTDNMKRALILMLLALSATSTFAQPHTIKRTDRLLTAPGLPRYRKGRDQTVPFIEAFRYEGNEEAKRWWTGYYEPNVSGAKTAEKARKKREKAYNVYEKEWDKMTDSLPHHRHLFIARPSFSSPFGLSYSPKDTALVYLEQRWDGNKKKGKKATFHSHKMKVTEAIYDSIQCLHKLAVYTSAQFDPDYTTLDGTSYHFVWYSFSGDKYARSSDNGSRTCKQLQKTFENICVALRADNLDQLQSLMPAVHELLAHYRTLLLPDVPIDDWDLDAAARKRNNK